MWCPFWGREIYMDPRGMVVPRALERVPGGQEELEGPLE